MTLTAASVCLALNYAAQGDLQRLLYQESSLKQQVRLVEGKECH